MIPSNPSLQEGGPDKKLIIAHRGASLDAPGNTLEAFAKAMEQGADMIELDVRRLKDGSLVIIHDPAIQGQAVADLALPELLGLNPDIPTLEQALRLCRGKVRLDVELKESGYEAESASLLLKYFTPEQFIISSSREPVLEKIRQDYPGLQLGLIVGAGEWRKAVKPALQAWKAKEYRCIILHENWLRLKLHRLYPSAAKLWVWTLDEERQIKKALLDRRVEGIITGKPAIALNLKMLHAIR